MFEQVATVAAAMEGYDGLWFISGGWAIDLFGGRVTRDHSDLEVGIVRHDQASLQAHLAAWELSKAVRQGDGGCWVPWQKGEYLDLPVHQIRAQRVAGAPFECEFFLNDVQDGMWQWRRGPELRRPVSEISMRGAAGIPILAPEIQLLYKAKWHRAKDEHDLATALPLLDAGGRAWLRVALETYQPADPWIAALS
ncbi:MAG: hypothetical protein NVSMB65_06580 [Chloroflexota bacterium]